jgi:hypothetical protein
VADSRDWREATSAFADWQLAVAGGCAAQQLLTARLAGGATATGFLVLAFGADGGFASDDATALDALTAFCSVIGAALLRRRALDAEQRSAAAVAASQSLACDIFPPHLVAALNRRSHERQNSAEGGGGGNGGGSADAELLMEHHEHVSIIFADVCGFTQIASELSPEASMRLLDALWQRFDTLATAHGCYKYARCAADCACAFARTHASLCQCCLLPQSGDHRRLLSRGVRPAARAEGPRARSAALRARPPRRRRRR